MGYWTSNPKRLFAMQLAAWIEDRVDQYPSMKGYHIEDISKRILKQYIKPDDIKMLEADGLLRQHPKFPNCYELAEEGGFPKQEPYL
jgi:hypothetical protein